MPTRPSQDGHPYFHGVRRIVLEGGERFATVVDHENAPAYYPTCYAFMRRETAQSVETIVADARDLVHLGLWAKRERIDIVARMDAGRHLDTAEIATLVEACAIKAAPFRRLVSGDVSEIRRGVTFTSRDVVTNAQKARRLATAARFLDYICRFAEHWLPANDPDLARRIEARAAMKADIVEARPKLRSSRVRGVIPAADLARVVAYVASAAPPSIGSHLPSSVSSLGGLPHEDVHRDRRFPEDLGHLRSG